MENLALTLYRAEQLRELDRLIAQDEGITGFELMTRAGETAFACLSKRWFAEQHYLIVCGAGNNAGDGYVIARLALVAGKKVQVYALVDAVKLSPDASLACHAYLAAGGVVQTDATKLDLDVDLVVDALLGTGLSRPVEGLFAEAIDLMNSINVPIFAVDIPSGLNADTGAVMAKAVHADCTMTFIGLKQGLFTGAAPDYCGELFLEPLTYSPAVYSKMPGSSHLVARKLFSKRSRIAHKGNCGHVLIVGGACGFSGAVMLAGEAALGVGSGLVSIATRPEHAGFLNLRRPELMSHGIESVEQLLPLLDKASVVVIGPGLGQNAWAKELFDVLTKSPKPLVVDADALNILADSPVHRENWILTPHPGEAARLLNNSTQQIQQDRFAAVRAIQLRYGGVVVLKGAGSLIADDHHIAVSTTGNPGMASGGMGDVLTGVIAALIAQGETLTDAARQGAFGHGWAADQAALEGEKGLVASDLMPYLRTWINA